MKKLIEELEWISDYYLVYFLYNPKKIERYHEYMEGKWNFGEDHSTHHKYTSLPVNNVQEKNNLSGGFGARHQR